MDSRPAVSCRPSKLDATGRLRLLCFAALFLVCCTVSLAAQPADRGWVCPPCDHGGHDEVYAEPGPCPVCGMELVRPSDLVEAPPLVAKEVAFRNRDVRLTGVVLSSLDGPGEPAPGIVVIHGSGTSDRTQRIMPVSHVWLAPYGSEVEVRLIGVRGGRLALRYQTGRLPISLQTQLCVKTRGFTPGEPLGAASFFAWGRSGEAAVDPYIIESPSNLPPTGASAPTAGVSLCDR